MFSLCLVLKTTSSLQQIRETMFTVHTRTNSFSLGHWPLLLVSHRKSQIVFLIILRPLEAGAMEGGALQPLNNYLTIFYFPFYISVLDEKEKNGQPPTPTVILLFSENQRETVCFFSFGPCDLFPDPGLSANLKLKNF